MEAHVAVAVSPAAFCRTELFGGPRHAKFPGMQWTRLSIRLAMRALRHPATGVALLRVAWRFRQRGWYRRFPFLPVPAMDYVRWRMYTAYGDEDVTPPVEDVERYARWAVRDP